MKKYTNPRFTIENLLYAILEPTFLSILFDESLETKKNLNCHIIL